MALCSAENFIMIDNNFKMGSIRTIHHHEYMNVNNIVVFHPISCDIGYKCYQSRYYEGVDVCFVRLDKIECEIMKQLTSRVDDKRFN